MKQEKIKVGMKVVPMKKTVGGYGDLSRSAVWRRAKERGQKFLYVVNFDGEEIYTLHEDRDSISGDYFNAEDFIMYSEKTKTGVVFTSSDELKIGMKVRVRSDLKEITYDGNSAVSEMVERAGRVFTIESDPDNPRGCYLNGGGCWLYTYDMLEAVFEIGDKVVPVDKTVLYKVKLSESPVWRRAKENNQPYVYVEKFVYNEDERRDIVVCTDRRGTGGDFFNVEDLIPYVGEEKKEVKPTKFSSYSDLKKGTLVRIKDNLDAHKEYSGNTVSFDMTRYRGMVTFVTSSTPNSFGVNLDVDKDNRWWTYDMVEPFYIPEEIGGGEFIGVGKCIRESGYEFKLSYGKTYVLYESTEEMVRFIGNDEKVHVAFKNRFEIIQEMPKEEKKIEPIEELEIDEEEKEQIFVNVVGASYYRGWGAFTYDMECYLEAEPNNPYDDEAVAVLDIHGKKIGMVSASVKTRILGCKSAGNIHRKLDERVTGVVKFINKEREIVIIEAYI